MISHQLCIELTVIVVTECLLHIDCTANWLYTDLTVTLNDDSALTVLQRRDLRIAQAEGDQSCAQASLPINQPPPGLAWSV